MAVYFPTDRLLCFLIKLPPFAPVVSSRSTDLLRERPILDGFTNAEMVDDDDAAAADDVFSPSEVVMVLLMLLDC